MRTLIALALLAAAPIARADLGLEAALMAGGRFPQVASDLGTAADVQLRVGYTRLLDRHLQLFLELGYAQPSRALDGTDPRLGAAGSGFTTQLTVKDLALSAGAAWIFPEVLVPGLAPYAGVVLQSHFVKSTSDGSAAGAAFGHHEETSTLFGAAALGGARYRLGPGLLLGELRIGTVPVHQRLTGAANLGALSVLLGYGIAF